VLFRHLSTHLPLLQRERDRKRERKTERARERERDLVVDCARSVPPSLPLAMRMVTTSALNSLTPPLSPCSTSACARRLLSVSPLVLVRCSAHILKGRLFSDFI
jgi:hypothetical protein